MSQKEGSRTPDLAELIRLAIKSNQADLHVSLPGKIESYNAAEQKADIKPLLKRPLIAIDGTRLESEEIPILHDVPICFPRGGAGSGNYFLSWPLAAGDLVHLIFVERSIDQWLDKQGEDTDPIDVRMHNLSDAVAYPGFYPRKLSLAEADPDNAVFGRDEGMQLHITPNDTAEFKVSGTADEVAVKGNAHKSTYDAHPHSSPFGPTGAPVTPMPASDLSTVLKFKS